MLQIKNHKFVGVEYIPSPNVSSGTIIPKFIVQHYTAGWTAESAIQTFLNKGAKVSSQLVVDRDGTITQMVPFNRKAWHAGPSQWAGFKYLNGHSIGIENANIGYLKRLGTDLWTNWNDTARMTTAQLIKVGYDPREFVEMAHPRLGSGVFYWPSYTQAQLEANDAIVASLCANYDIKDIVTHEEIDSRGWKTDPGPAFPMARYKNILRVGHRADPEDGGASINEAYPVKVTAGTLNVRTGPGPQWEVFGTLKRNDIRRVLKQEGDWLFVSLSGDREGWIHGGYTERVG